MTGFLTVLTGLAGVYIFLALITSHFAEAVASLVGQRGKALYTGLRDLLGDVSTVAAAGHVDKLADHLYAHPLVDGLGSEKRKPSYVPVRSLTLSLVSVLHGLNAAATAAPNAAAAPARLLDDLLNDVNALQSSNGVAKALVMVLQTAKNDYNTALKAIDGWFNDAMDRISGAYKRWSFGVQLVIALFVVVALDADTLAIVEQLSKNATVAAAVAAAAAKTTGNDTLQQLLTALAATNLQLGWTDFNWAASAATVAQKIAGLLLTWAAVLLGAPFWFDLLKQVVPVRLSGTKPPDPKAPARDAQTRPAG